MVIGNYFSFMPRKFNGFSSELTRSQALLQGDFIFLNRNIETGHFHQTAAVLHTENRQGLGEKN